MMSLFYGLKVQLWRWKVKSCTLIYNTNGRKVNLITVKPYNIFNLFIWYWSVLNLYFFTCPQVWIHLLRVPTSVIVFPSLSSFTSSRLCYLPFCVPLCLTVFGFSFLWHFEAFVWNSDFSWSRSSFFLCYLLWYWNTFGVNGNKLYLILKTVRCHLWNWTVEYSQCDS